MTDLVEACFEDLPIDGVLLADGFFLAVVFLRAGLAAFFLLAGAALVFVGWGLLSALDAIWGLFGSRRGSGPGALGFGEGRGRSGRVAGVVVLCASAT